MIERSLVRLSAVLSALESHPEGLSARELAEITGYPETDILDDLNVIAEQVELAGHYVLYADEPETEEDPAAGWDEPVNLQVRDPGTKWFLETRDEPFPALSLSLRESLALLMAFEEYPPGGRLGELAAEIFEAVTGAGPAAAAEIRRQVKFQGGVILESSRYLPKLREAVLKQRKVRVIYFAKNYSREVNWLLKPLGLVFYNATGFWYLVAVECRSGDEVVCRVDRIRSLQVTDEEFEYPAGFSLREYLRNRWGMDMSEAVRVRVRFYDEAGVIEKAAAEFRRRGLPPLQVQPDGSAIFEGEIKGVNNFTKWLLGFGSAVEVLEPAWLRRQVIEIARSMLRIYGGERREARRDDEARLSL